MTKKKPQAQFVPAEAYKPLVPKDRQKAALAMLKSSETLARAARTIATKAAGLRSVVLELVEKLETAARAGDWPAAFAAAHEIRGLAGNAGLVATGRIANGFCQYLDTVEMMRATPDRMVAELHVDAMVRSSRTEDDTARHGDAVVENLAALVNRKLGAIKE